MSIKIWPYKQGSRGASALASGIRSVRPTSRCRVLLPEGTSRWRGGRSSLVVNWGNSESQQRFSNLRVLNPPGQLAHWVNKRTACRNFYRTCPDHAVPATTDRSQAQRMCDDGHKIVCRHKLTGHSGEGIEIINPESEVPLAPLYTLYLKKRREYRLHFFKQWDEWDFLLQQKRRNTNVPDGEVNWEVRNHSNGFIYATDNVDPIDDDQFSSIERSMRTLFQGQDFGALDIIECNNRNGELSDSFRFLELNTACGIEAPSVLNFYTNNILKRYA